MVNDVDGSKDSYCRESTKCDDGRDFVANVIFVIFKAPYCNTWIISITYIFIIFISAAHLFPQAAVFGLNMAKLGLGIVLPLINPQLAVSLSWIDKIGTNILARTGDDQVKVKVKGS